MIGKIQDKNFSVPLEETASSQIVSLSDRSIQDSEDKPIPKSLGVAKVQDGFEEVQENGLLQQIGLGSKSVYDPIGYPGEEWLWQD